MGRFQQGQSGNPAGRPPKGRALTDILERAGAATLEVDDKKVSGKQLIARMVWELATKGEVTLPGGKTLVAEPEEWIATVKWIYQHIDGPAKQEIRQEIDMEVSGGVNLYIPDNGRDKGE